MGHQQLQPVRYCLDGGISLSCAELLLQPDSSQTTSDTPAVWAATFTFYVFLLQFQYCSPGHAHYFGAHLCPHQLDLFPPWQLPPHLWIHLLEYTFEMNIGRVASVFERLFVFRAILRPGLLSLLFSVRKKLVGRSQNAAAARDRLEPPTATLWPFQKKDNRTNLSNVLKLMQHSYTPL